MIFCIRKKKKINLVLKSKLCKVYNLLPFNNKKLNIMLRYIKFIEFNKENIVKSKYVLHKDLWNDEINNKISESYNYFISGSDQIWNPNSPFCNRYAFLDFAKKGQKIAYAPSFGINKLPAEYEKSYKRWIDNIDYLSVREEVGAYIIKELTGRDAEVLVDPTIMLSKDEWLSIAQKPKCYKGKKYILTYFLGKMSEEVNIKLNKLARENNYEIINLLDKMDREVYSVDPSEFIWLINNAQLMCTDSFHGVVFSLIMKTPFVVLNRIDQFGSMNSRIDNLLKLFNKEERYEMSIDNKDIFSMDFSNVDSIMDIERKKAYRYLRNAMNL